MAKKHKNRPSVSTTWWWAWSPEVAAMFGAIKPSWTPPKKVRISRDRDRFVVSARFVTDKGFTNIARLRIAEVAGDVSAEPTIRGMAGRVMVDEFAGAEG